MAIEEVEQGFLEQGVLRLDPLVIRVVGLFTHIAKPPPAAPWPPKLLDKRLPTD